MRPLLLWQRALFAIFGVDILSTTAVRAFLLGLGLGSLFGGVLSRSHQWLALLFFGLMEIAAGGFGAVSLHLIEGAGVIAAGVLATRDKSAWECLPEAREVGAPFRLS